MCQELVRIAALLSLHDFGSTSLRQGFEYTLRAAWRELLAEPVFRGSLENLEFCMPLRCEYTSFHLRNLRHQHTCFSCTANQDVDRFNVSALRPAIVRGLFRCGCSGCKPDAICVRIRAELQSVCTFMPIQRKANMSRVTKESDLLIMLGTDLVVFPQWPRHI